MIPAVLDAALEAPDLLMSPRTGDPARSTTRPALAGAATRSYLDDGAGIGWVVDVPPRWCVAIDAERLGQELPPHVRRRSGLDDTVSDVAALAAWTRAEVLAKLTDTPILLRVRRFGLGLDDLDDLAPVALQTHVVGDVVVTVGVRPDEPTSG